MRDGLVDDPVFEYKILDAVQNNDGALTQRHISQRLGRSVSSVNFALRLLAAKGFIKITGSNPRSLRYNLTPSGILHKSIVAYNFLKRQRALYDEVRKGLLQKLEQIVSDGVESASVYGWSPFTECAILYLVFGGIKVHAIYVGGPEEVGHWHTIPVRLIDEFQSDCDVLVLMEPLPEGRDTNIRVRLVTCFRPD
jgi:predicted transcriptional regulator